MYKFRSFPFYNGNLTFYERHQRLIRHLETEFRNIESEISKMRHLDVTYSAPTKISDGDVYYADGTDWNPGSGRGIYFYDSEVPGWVKLG